MNNRSADAGTRHLARTGGREDAKFFRTNARPAGKTLGGIYVEQVSALFRQMPIALAVNTVNATITAAVLQQLVAVTLPLGLSVP